MELTGWILAPGKWLHSRLEDGQLIPADEWAENISRINLYGKIYKEIKKEIKEDWPSLATTS